MKLNMTIQTCGAASTAELRRGRYVNILFITEFELIRIHQRIHVKKGGRSGLHVLHEIHCCGELSFFLAVGLVYFTCPFGVRPSDLMTSFRAVVERCLRPIEKLKATAFMSFSVYHAG